MNELEIEIVPVSNKQASRIARILDCSTQLNLITIGKNLQYALNKVRSENGHLLMIRRPDEPYELVAVAGVSGIYSTLLIHFYFVREDYQKLPVNIASKLYGAIHDYNSKHGQYYEYYLIPCLLQSGSETEKKCFSKITNEYDEDFLPTGEKVRWYNIPRCDLIKLL